MSNQKRLEGRVALVTGASRGFGRACALELAKEGADIIAVGRTVGALEELDDDIRELGGHTTILQLDLNDMDKIDQIGPALYQRWERLDIFVAAAGMLGALSPLPHTTVDGWSRVVNVNLSANWRLIRTLDPLLRLSDAGRAVFVTDAEAHNATAYWGAYAASKAGLEALVKTYADELAHSPICVSLFDPGPMQTALRAKAFPGEDADALLDPEDIAVQIVELVLPTFTSNGERFVAQD